jgi:hypothetical protein
LQSVAFTNGKVGFAEVVDLFNLLAGIDNSLNVLPDLWPYVLLQGASAHDFLVADQSDERRVRYGRVGDIGAKGLKIAPLISPSCDRPCSKHHIRSYAKPSKLASKMLEVVMPV